MVRLNKTSLSLHLLFGDILRWGEEKWNRSQAIHIYIFFFLPGGKVLTQNQNLAPTCLFYKSCWALKADVSVGKSLRGWHADPSSGQKKKLSVICGNVCCLIAEVLACSASRSCLCVLLRWAVNLLLRVFCDVFYDFVPDKTEGEIQLLITFDKRVRRLRPRTDNTCSYAHAQN